jgi:hypothetical protein
MYPHTSTKNKLHKQTILIDFFYSNHKENLYYNCNSNTCKANSNTFNVDSSTPIITKTEGFITKTEAS